MLTTFTSCPSSSMGMWLNSRIVSPVHKFTRARPSVRGRYGVYLGALINCGRPASAAASGPNLDFVCAA